MTSGCRGTPYFRRYDRELILKPTISLKKSWGGYLRTTLAVLFPDGNHNRYIAAHHVARAGDESPSATTHVLGYHDTGNERLPSRPAVLFFSQWPRSQRNDTRNL